jgi:hypothetical protein
VVAVVPCCWQEEMSIMPSMALIKHNRYLFIVLSVSVRVPQNVWLPKKFTTC